MTALTFARLRNGAIATVAALSMAAATAMPAQALDKKDRAFIGGVATAVIVGALINQSQQNRGRPDRYDEPRYYTPAYEDDYAQDYRPDYRRDHRPDYRYGHDQPRHRPAPVYAPAPSYYGSAVSYGFAEFSPASKRAIQSRLRAYGYYRGGIDGVYGSGTRSAIEAYARDTGNAALLNSRNGVVSLLNSLLA